MLIDVVINYCNNHGIITINEMPILRYCLEKKIYTFAVTIPIFILCIHLSDIFTSISFIASFYYLRSATGGFHAKNVVHCFIGSIGSVYILFKFIQPLLKPHFCGITTVVSFYLIWHYAPYNHPNMNFSSDEICACQQRSRKRLCVVIMLMLIISRHHGASRILGIMLGLLLDASLLSAGYLFNFRRRKHGKTQRKKARQNNQENHQEDDSRRS